MVTDFSNAYIASLHEQQLLDLQNHVIVFHYTHLGIKLHKLIFICHVGYDLNSKLQKWHNGIKLSSCTTIFSLILLKTGI